MSRLIRMTLVLAAVLMIPARAMACAVCYGDPNSLQVQGAEAGVLVLLGVIVTVLLSIAGMILFWILRAKRITQSVNTISLPA
jgi:hypothetical protein